MMSRTAQAVTRKLEGKEVVVNAELDASLWDEGRGARRIREFDAELWQAMERIELSSDEDDYATFSFPVNGTDQRDIIVSSRDDGKFHVDFQADFTLDEFTPKKENEG